MLSLVPDIALLLCPLMEFDWPIMPFAAGFFFAGLLAGLAGAIAFVPDIEFVLDIADPDMAVLDCTALPSAKAAVLHIRPRTKAVETIFMGYLLEFFGR
jgi:hypothetical protein